MKIFDVLKRARTALALAGLMALSGCAVSVPREAEVRTQLPATARWAASVWGAAIPGQGTGDEPSDGPDVVSGVRSVVGSGAAPAEASVGASVGTSPPRVLTAEGAVRLAFGENPRARLLRAEFLKEMAAVDAAAAAGGVSWSWSRLRPEAGLAQLALALSVPLEDWLTLPARRRQAYWDRAAAAQRAGWETLQLEHEVRIAWATAVGMAQRSAELATAAEVAGLEAELSSRYHDAGSLSRADWHAHELQSGEALSAAAEASVAAAIARATLATLLGLPSTDPRLLLPEQLPALPPIPSADTERTAALAAQALRQRLDLRAARSGVTARLLEAARVHRWSKLPALQLGVESEREPDGERRRGPALEGEWSPVRVAEAGLAAATVNAAQAQAELLAVQVVNEVTLRTQAYRRAVELANLQSERLVPLQEAKLSESLKRYNYMLEGPFAPLEERRHGAAMAARASEWRLAAWVAFQELQQALGDAP